MMAIPARDRTIGELCAATLGMPEQEISEQDVWLYVGGATEPGAYCPLSRRDVPDVWDRFVVPLRAVERMRG